MVSLAVFHRRETQTRHPSRHEHVEPAERLDVLGERLPLGGVERERGVHGTGSRISKAATIGTSRGARGRTASNATAVKEARLTATNGPRKNCQ